MFRHDWFTSAGGFGDARSATEEDVAFARIATRRGDRVVFLAAADLLTVRAYEGFADTWRGWGRSIGLVSVNPPLKRSIDVTVLACTMPLPWLRLITRRADLVDAVALMVRVGTLAGTSNSYAGGVRWGRVAYWASPMADGVAWLAVVVGSLPMQRTWRSRRMVLGAIHGRVAHMAALDG